jgi:hypothetical protein
MSTEKYLKVSINEPLILEPEDHTEEEWATILKIFGMKEADRIVLSDYTMEAYGVSESVVSDEEWDKAIEYLKMLIVEYASIGFAGRFGLDGVLIPLKKRYENGERSKALYDAIMECE